MPWQHRDPLEGDYFDPDPPEEDLPLDEDAPIPLELLEDEIPEWAEQQQKREALAGQQWAERVWVQR